MHIYRGDVILITGKSGAGKSTLLYALKGLFPDIIKGNLSGSIEFNGQPISQLTAQQRLKIGIVFQNPNQQIINRLVIDELAFGLENLSYSPMQIRNEIEQVAHKYNLSHLLSRELTSLSLGEKQRIILLSVILTQPEVLLLDEPTAFLDAGAAHLFMQLVQEVSHNKTVVIVEHNLDFVKNIVTRVLNVNHSGTIEEMPHNSLALDNYSQNYIPLIKTDKKLLLEVNELTFAYNQNLPLFTQLSFTLYAGECLGIVGASGAGKSTLLKLLAGIERNYGGSIRIANKDIKTIDKKNLYRQLGLLLQNPENHFLATSVAKELDNDLALLELFDLLALKEYNPFTLSEGQKRRLSLAIVFKQVCNIYLLDEPSFGQDMSNKIKLINLIRTLQASGASFIIVSHDDEFIRSLCNRVVNLNNKT